MGVFILKTMALFRYKNLTLLTKRTKKHIITFILGTLFYNFLIFPVHAADDISGVMSGDYDYQVIKAPDTEINLHEKLTTDPSNESQFFFLKKSDDGSRFAKNLKVVVDPTTSPLMDLYKENKERQAIHIASLDNKSISDSKSVTLTAYNSEVEQCDGDPCTTASGFNVCKHGIEDTVAANFLPLGTKIKIPELFGDRIFTVRDRTARRFSNRVDVWMVKKTDALKFGIKKADIVIINE